MSGMTNTFHIGLDKSVYSPGETVTIHMESTHNSSTTTHVLLKILDATADIKGTNTIYEDTQNISNGSIIFHYAIPQETNMQTSYRYLIQVYQDNNPVGILGSAYFLTQPDANQLSISKVKVLTLKVSPGQAINFTARVQDGLGTDVGNLDVKVDLPQSHGDNYLSGNATFDNYTKLYVGTIPVPKSFDATNLPLQYYLEVTAQGPTGAGFIPDQYNGGIVNIIPATIPEFPFVSTMVLMIVFVALVSVTTLTTLNLFKR